MCGRFSLDEAIKEWREYFQAQIDQFSLWEPSFNIAPSQMSPVITSAEPSLIQIFKWGIIPPWSLDAKTGFKTFNAKAETLLEKPTFKNLLQSKRCIVPTSCFYEWRDEGEKKKQKYRFRTKERFTVLAGLWDYNPKLNVKTFTVITCEPNSLMADYHNRMPVILSEDTRKKWLSPDLPKEEALQLLKPFDGEILVEKAA